MMAPPRRHEESEEGTSEKPQGISRGEAKGTPRAEGGHSIAPLDEAPSLAAPVLPSSRTLSLSKQLYALPHSLVNSSATR